MSNLIDLTRNIDLEIIADSNADNWVKISNFPTESLVSAWGFIVSEYKDSETLFTSSQADNISVDLVSGSVVLNIPSGSLEEGSYYYRLYSDTEESGEKYRFGGANQLKIIKY